MAEDPAVGVHCKKSPTAATSPRASTPAASSGIALANGVNFKSEDSDDYVRQFTRLCKTINILRPLFESAQLVLFCRNFDLRYVSAAQEAECSACTAVFFQNPSTPAVLPRDAEGLKVMVAMCVLAGDAVESFTE